MPCLVSSVKSDEIELGDSTVKHANAKHPKLRLLQEAKLMSARAATVQILLLSEIHPYIFCLLHWERGSVWNPRVTSPD